MNSQQPPSIQFTIDPRNLLQSSLNIVLETFPLWLEDIKDDSNSVLLEECRNGITNKLVKCHNKKRGITVLIRTYGKGSEELIDRKHEISNSIRLSSLGLCPPIYSTFCNGFVYGYTEGTPLTPEMMRDEKNSLLIAKTLSTWHRIIPTNKEDSDKSIFRSLRDWISILEEKKISIPLGVKEDIDSLEKVFLDSNGKKEMVFCHNDLLSGNLILSPTEDEVSFIDFEYGGLNYAEFDIANHFCEWCGFDFDPQLHPSLEEQDAFLKEYAGGDFDGSDSFKRGIMVMTLCSHLYWGIWALIQNANSDIDFNYVAYSTKRFSLYQEQKRDIL